jgi:hypothetical protein
MRSKPLRTLSGDREKTLRCRKRAMYTIDLWLFSIAERGLPPRSFSSFRQAQEIRAAFGVTTRYDIKLSAFAELLQRVATGSLE